MAWGDFVFGFVLWLPGLGWGLFLLLFACLFIFVGFGFGS